MVVQTLLPALDRGLLALASRPPLRKDDALHVVGAERAELRDLRKRITDPGARQVRGAWEGTTRMDEKSSGYVLY